jgi:hypothetical protein
MGASSDGARGHVMVRTSQWQKKLVSIETTFDALTE